MRLIRTLGATCAVAAAALPVGCASSAHPAAHAVVTGCKAQPGTQLTVTRSYRFALRLGAQENMYMPSQVRANHPQHGEAMLRGKMAGPSLMMGGPLRHLEVQICDRSTNAVVKNANPTILVEDRTSGKTTNLPVAVMEDIAVGAADLHYGNNIAMPAKHRYLVSVTLKGEDATFHLTAPRG